MHAIRKKKQKTRKLQLFVNLLPRHFLSKPYPLKLSVPSLNNNDSTGSTSKVIKRRKGIFHCDQNKNERRRNYSRYNQKNHSKKKYSSGLKLPFNPIGLPLYQFPDFHLLRTLNKIHRFLQWSVPPTSIHAKRNTSAYNFKQENYN